MKLTGRYKVQRTDDTFQQRWRCQKRFEIEALEDRLKEKWEAPSSLSECSQPTQGQVTDPMHDCIRKRAGWITVIMPQFIYICIVYMHSLFVIIYSTVSPRCLDLSGSPQWCLCAAALHCGQSALFSGVMSLICSCNRWERQKMSMYWHE